VIGFFIVHSILGNRDCIKWIILSPSYNASYTPLPLPLTQLPLLSPALFTLINCMPSVSEIINWLTLKLLSFFFFQQNGSAMSALGSELENAAAAMGNGHEPSGSGV
jgi:hypothetical protein